MVGVPFLLFLLISCFLSRNTVDGLYSKFGPATCSNSLRGCISVSVEVWGVQDSHPHLLFSLTPAPLGPLGHSSSATTLMGLRRLRTADPRSPTRQPLTLLINNWQLGFGNTSSPSFTPAKIAVPFQAVCWIQLLQTSHRQRPQCRACPFSLVVSHPHSGEAQSCL